jgi:hypothetical protein
MIQRIQGICYRPSGLFAMLRLSWGRDNDYGWGDNKDSGVGHDLHRTWNLCQSGDWHHMCLNHCN